MHLKNEEYKRAIEDNFRIVNKKSKVVDFKLNSIQRKYLNYDYTGYDTILKARQQGFSSLILALFTTDFLLKENSRSVVVADSDENSAELLDRSKFFIKSFGEKHKLKVPLKYNSKRELFNEAKNSRYTIGTAKNVEFGRSKTINNLHLSEYAFYADPEKIIASAGQAVVEGGRLLIETTANGFNFFKSLWDDCVRGDDVYKPLFYPASKFYSEKFLAMKRKQLKRLFEQEYPETPEEAFLTSGDVYFDTDSLKAMLLKTKKPLTSDLIYV